jgi:hypothetical protein
MRSIETVRSFILDMIAHAISAQFDAACAAMCFESGSTDLPVGHSDRLRRPGAALTFVDSPRDALKGLDPEREQYA